MDQIKALIPYCFWLIVGFIIPQVQAGGFPMPISFYDTLYSAKDFNVTVLKGSNDGRVLHFVEETNNDKRFFPAVRLCHIPMFFQYTEEKDKGKAKDEVGEKPKVTNWASFDGSVGALLGIYHFNNGISTIVPQLENVNETCNIRLTTSIFDTKYSPSSALKEFMRITGSDYNEGMDNTKPCALLGSSRDLINEDLAVLTEVYELLHVSPAVTSSPKDFEKEFPLFARTNPTIFGWADMLLHYLYDVLKVRYISILSDNSKQGFEFQDAVLGSKTGYPGLKIEQANYPEQWDEDKVRKAVRKISDGDRNRYKRAFNYFVGQFRPEHFGNVTKICLEEGIAGPGKMWFFKSTSSEYFVEPVVLNDPQIATAIQGNAVLENQGGISGLIQYDAFIQEWKDIGRDKEALNYFNSKQPSNATKPGDYFQAPPDKIAMYSYDAVVGMGLAACASSQGNSDDHYFSGYDHHTAFVNQEFEGATGQVIIDAKNSRSSTSTTFVVSNILPTQKSVQLEFLATPKMFYNYESRGWTGIENAGKYIYSDSSTLPPSDVPHVVENRNRMSSQVRGFGLSLSVIGMGSSIIFSMYTFLKEDHEVLRKSQPRFLHMLCFGTFVMSSSIIPMAIDDSIASEKNCSFACNATLWLISTGFTITFSALFSKHFRIIWLISSAQQMKRVTVTFKDVLVPFAVLTMVNIIILIINAATDPIKWVRNDVEIDSFGQVLESEGRCTHDGFLPYAVSLLFVNGIALIAAIITAFRARHMPTDLQESKFIGIALISIFQSLAFSGPVLALVYKNATPFFFVSVSFIFTICMVVLLLMFLPKVRAIEFPKGENDDDFQVE